MKTIMLLTISALISLTILGQEADSLQKSKMDEMMKEMELRQQKQQPIQVDNFSNYFKPHLIDTFFIFIQQDKYDQLYKNSDDQLKKLQSKEDLIKYFNAIKNIYGQLKSYEQETYSIKNQMMSMKKTALATYKAEFDNVKAQITTAFNVIDSSTIKLMTFQISTEDYTEIKEFDKLTKPALDYLISKDYPGLYNSTSKRFQDYTTIAKYEEFMSQLDTVEFNNHKLYRNQIGVVQGRLMYNLTYDINDSDGYLTLTYTESDGQFLLEGLNYKPKE